MSMPPELPRKRLRAGVGTRRTASSGTPTRVNGVRKELAEPSHCVLAPVSTDANDVPPTPPVEKFYSLRSSDVVLNKCRCCQCRCKLCTGPHVDRVRGSVGYGSFGTVVQAEDKITGTTVAVKLLHNTSHSSAKSRNEEQVYRKLLAGCDPHIDLFAAVLASGMHRGFYCIVFEFCDCTLYDILKDYAGLLPLPARHVMEIGYQLLRAIEYLHSLGIAHTDLKPDNIALRSQDSFDAQWLDPHIGFKQKKMLVSTQICIIDLGNAMQVSPDVRMPGRVGAKQYRAPEVILGLRWSFGVDIFAIGCVLAELYLMHPLFNIEICGDHEHLAAVDRILGPFPTAYAQWIDTKFPLTFCYGEQVSVRYPPADTPASKELHLESMQRLEALKPLSARMHNVVLHDLCRGLMALDPDKRLSAEVAAKHKYFDGLHKFHLQ